VCRVPLSLDIVRDRARLYREVYDGGIENTYTLKILNMDQVGHQVALSAAGELAVQYAGKQEVFVEAGEALSLPIHLVVSPEDLKSAEGNTDVTFTAQSMDEPKVRATDMSRFIRPMY
jgi:polyferredoxin